MTEKMKNILIGFFVTGAVTCMIVMILFLDPKIGDGKKTLQVRFSNIAGIMNGTRVTFAGKPVGEVEAIQEIQNARELASDESGKVYFYLLTLKLDSSVDVFNYDEIAIRTTGLMGEKSVAIIPKLPPHGKVATPITTQIMTANSIDPLENTFNQVAKASMRMEKSLDHVDHWFLENQKNISETITTLNGFLHKSETFVGNLNQSELVPSLSSASDKLNENLNIIYQSLQDEQLLTKISNLTESMHKALETFNHEGALTLQNLQQITKDISKGNGTVGKLVTADDLYLKVNSLLSKGETLMNDINHYGLLFQYDKHWQKSRTKKANILKSVETPKEFKNYFEGEIDNITTSLGRLNELFDTASSDKEKIMSSTQFKNQFASLLRNVQSLSNSLKLYNESLFSQTDE